MICSNLNLLCVTALALFPTVHSAAISVTEFPAESLWKRDDVEISERSEYEAPVLEYRSDEVHSNYIIIFKKDTSHSKRSLHHDWLSDVMAKTKSIVKAVSNCDSEVRTITNNIKGYLNTSAVQGYFGSFTPAVIEQIKASEDIEIIEKDSYDKVSDFVYLQSGAPWGLGRLSHKDFESSSDNSQYVFDSAAGANTTIYILDSGVKASHQDFTGRVRWGANYVDNLEVDVVGHGTHVAGSAAGYTVGVAKYANIVSVKVIDAKASAAISNIVQGISWIIEDHNNNPGQKSIINYSAVGSISDARTYAINQAISAGIMLVTAAGNSDVDACTKGPSDLGNQDGVITVGALNYTNTPATFSNYGSCVSVYSPGVDVLSCGNDTDSQYKYMSGTSMACPYVSGLVSYFWSQNSSYSLSEVKDLVINYNNDKITGLDSASPNRIAYNHL